MEQERADQDQRYTQTKSKTYTKKHETEIFKQQMKRTREQLSQIKSEFSREDFSVLDLGCGSGAFTRILREFTKGPIVGLDASQNMINLAKDEEKDSKLGIKYFKADCFEDLSSIVGNQKFDLITGSWFIQYANTYDVLKGFAIHVAK